ncbi:MAG: Obg family GTPase CgtA [Parcubacteria group bacterium RIFOXYD2_FULL_52_8]|nr:MAG: Obg family GTPase CgtA [Parcubacteria group bacterium RIFOXYD2_FULL_52_8]
MLIDEVKISVEGGKGGKGGMTFGEGKFSNMPSGGEGGNGGSVFVEASSSVLDLGQYRFQKDFQGGDGEPGHRNKDGKDGEDVVLKVPRGTVVHNLTSGIDNELLNDGDRVQVAHGGLRGRGNRAFSHARGSEPKRFEPGKPGFSAKLFLELQLIADIGLLGLPNVGKSSLLNTLTKSRSKVANYNFTTLEPHLGVLENGSIMADIPGIIEGASEGKGLGTKFLRHIRRTKILLHCISAESADPIADYVTIRNELQQYGHSLEERKEQILFTKADMVDPTELKKRMALFKKQKPWSVSVLDDAGVKELKKNLIKLLD